MRKPPARRLRLAAGVVLGGLTALADLLYVLAGGLWLLATLRLRAARGAEDRVFAGARLLAGLERRRITACYGAELAPPPAGRPVFAYLAARWPLGLLGAAVVLTGLVAAAYASTLGWIWFAVDIEHPGNVVATGVAGLFLLFLCVQGVYGVALLDEQLARRSFGPGEKELLERRIGELADSRAGVVQAVHDERRRIERDLHDGVQQRLVALGMLLGRARRSSDPGKAEALLRQAHEESGQALAELRDAAWRIHPAALDQGGLAAALETVAERAAVPVDLAYEPAAEPPDPVRTVAYFVVAEAVTNAVKHSGAARIAVRVGRQGSMVVVRIEDDGHGGADPDGSGLLGLSRRVAALDGRLTVASPPGGPTSVTAELPCA